MESSNDTLISEARFLIVEGKKLLRPYNSAFRPQESGRHAKTQLRREMRFPRGGGVYGDAADK